MEKLMEPYALHNKFLDVVVANARHYLNAETKLEPVVQKGGAAEGSPYLQVTLKVTSISYEIERMHLHKVLYENGVRDIEVTKKHSSEEWKIPLADTKGIALETKLDAALASFQPRARSR